jgi:uncharacterized delta-60 repeat protein
LVVAVTEAGPTAPTAISKIVVLRLLPSGDIDSSFATDGSIAIDFGGTPAFPSQAILQPDGRILANGLADNDFGNAGIVTLQAGEGGSFSQVESIALQPDGKIVAVGTVSQWHSPSDFRRIAVARFNQDGSLDTLFAPGGVTLAWSNFGADGYGVGIQPSGRIVVLGVTEGPLQQHSGFDAGIVFTYWLQQYTPSVFGFVGGNAPSSRSTRQAAAVEYYHAGFDHYFVTADAYETAVLDTDTDPRFTSDWVRTGLSFRVYSESTDGLSPVCRFFSGSTFAPKSSHFYTPYRAECDALKNESVWLYEGNAFYLGFPNGQAVCLPPSQALFRLGGRLRGARTTDKSRTRSLLITDVSESWLRLALCG